jgi:hypothetical protein
MAGALPFYIPSDEETNNFKFIDAIGSALESVDADIEAVDVANTVQTATTIDQLAELGALVNVPPEADETLEHYRTRLLIWFKLVTAEGTIADIMDALLALMPDLTVEDIGFSRTSENGYVIFTVPNAAFQSLAVGPAELSRLMNQNAAAGFRIGIRYATGTFTYRSVGGANDPAKGYANGTYSGLIGN